jgi:hypothetical protein
MAAPRLSISVAYLSFLLTSALPAYYLLTGDYDLLERMPAPGVFMILGLELVVPLGLLLGLCLLSNAGVHPTRLGAIAGLALGMWLTTVALGVPYCGFYPNLMPSSIAFLAGTLSGTDLPDPRLTFTVIFIYNLAFYPLVGWALARLVQHPQPPQSLDRCPSTKGA